MPATLTSKLKLAHKWVLGESGWHTGMDKNLELLDAITPNMVVQNSVDATSNTPPGSPMLGGVYWIAGAPTGAWSGQANKLGIYLSSGWTFLTPWPGLTVTRVISYTPLVYIWVASDWYPVPITPP